MEKQLFGGNWTEEKLERVKKYLIAYATIMKKQSFRFAYIDAFAGTGYRNLKRDNNATGVMFPEFSEDDSQSFLKGSAEKALEVEPQFHKYIFIEKDESRFKALKILRDRYPQHDISLINADCNAYLQDLCLNYKWVNNRAVLFLDPFGMQVQWQTIVAISQTKAIDLWLLFPLLGCGQKPLGSHQLEKYSFVFVMFCGRQPKRFKNSGKNCPRYSEKMRL